MTVRLYLEANFLLSHARGRDLATDRLIAASMPGLQVAIPTCCVMEALTHLEGEQTRINRLVGTNEPLISELSRNIISPRAARLVSGLRAAEWEWQLELEFFGDRLRNAIQWLSDASRVTCLATGPADLNPVSPAPAGLDPTDQLILVMILRDARGHPSISSVLLTENRRCFHDNLVVRQSLSAGGIQSFAPASKFLQWYEARAES